MKSTATPTPCPVCPHRVGLSAALDQRGEALTAEIAALAQAREELAELAAAPRQRLVAESFAVELAKKEFLVRQKIGAFLSDQRDAAAAAAEGQHDRHLRLRREVVDALVAVGFPSGEPWVDGFAARHPGVRDAIVESDSLRSFASELLPIEKQNRADLALLEAWLGEHDLIPLADGRRAAAEIPA